MPTSSITRLLRKRRSPIVRPAPLAKAEPAVDLLHSLVGQVARVRVISPGKGFHITGVLDIPDEQQDITGRISGIRSSSAGETAVGFVIGGFFTYRTDSLEVIAAPPAAERVVEHTHPMAGMFR